MTSFLRPLVSRYRDRRHAGRVLAAALAEFGPPHDSVILALPRGGVPVGFEVAAALHAPLDVFVVRKLGLPGHPELAMGAIASGGTRVLNDDVVRWYGLTHEDIEAVTRAELQELARREAEYRGGRELIPVAGRIAILVDDGLATGATMHAAVAALRTLNPLRVIAAAPVGAPETCWKLRSVADDVVCPLTPEGFTAVGLWYEDFNQTSDHEVRLYLAEANAGSTRAAS
jgi:predicted phosphoribosyltransferase